MKTYVPTSELARVAGVALRTAQKKLKTAEITPDAQIVCGRRSPIHLFESERVDRIKSVLQGSEVAV